MKRFYSIILSMALILSVSPMGLSVSAANVDSYYSGITAYIDGAANKAEAEKLSDGHYISAAEVRALNNTVTDITKTFYVNLDSADEYVEFGFSSNVKDGSLRGLDLWLRGTKTTDGVTVTEEIDYEIQNYIWTPDGWEWTPIYSGTTPKYEGTLVLRHNSSFYCPYYPETPFTGTMGIRLVPKNLEEGESLQISEAKIKKTADSANNLLARGLLYTNIWNNALWYYRNYTTGEKTTPDGTTLDAEKNRRQMIYTINPYMEGFAVSNADGAAATRYKVDVTEKTATTDSDYPGSQWWYGPQGGWPSKATNDSPTYLSIPSVIPDANGNCWWMGDMLEVKQKINHIKVNKTAGTVKEVSVYTCDDDAAFNNPAYTGWVLRKTEVNEAGVTDVYLHDAVSARFWMIKVNDTDVYYDETLKLQPFGLYHELESKLPSFINKGTITGTLASGETLTYTTEFENQNRNAIVIFAVYENDVLKSAAPVAISLKDNKVQGNDSATATYKIPEGLTGTVTCKAFLWNGLTELVPIVEESYLPEQ